MKHNKIVFLCGIVSFFLSVGNLLVSFFTKQLIDAPSFEIVVKLGMVWLTSVLINLTKNYMVQRHYLKKQKNYMCVLLKGIFSFPFCFLESKQYNEDLNRVKGLVSYEQSFVSSIEGITTAGCGIIGLYVLLFNQVSALILFFLSIFLVIIIIISVSINRKLSVLMYDYWKNYIENTRKYNYISSVLSNKEYVEEKKVYSYLPFFSCEFDKEFDFASKKNRALGSRRIKLELLSDTIFLIYSLIGFLILLYAFIECEISIGLGLYYKLLKYVTSKTIILQNVAQFGNAKDNNIDSFLENNKFQNVKCEQVMNPCITYTGDVYACCGPCVSLGTDNVLYISNLSNNDLASIIEQMKTNRTIISIYEQGPYCLKKDKRNNYCSSLCDFCMENY